MHELLRKAFERKEALTCADTMIALPVIWALMVVKLTGFTALRISLIALLF